MFSTTPLIEQQTLVNSRYVNVSFSTVGILQLDLYKSFAHDQVHGLAADEMAMHASNDLA